MMFNADIYAKVPMIAGVPVITFPLVDRWRIGMHNHNSTECIIGGVLTTEQQEQIELAGGLILTQEDARIQANEWEEDFPNDPTRG